MTQHIPSEHIFRTSTEISIAQEVAIAFERSEDPVGTRLDNFPKYVRRVPLKRFLAMYELFKLISPLKGSIVECGVFRGFGVMSWAKLSAILEPENLTRRIYGFDTFGGFPTVSGTDLSGKAIAAVGELASDSEAELRELISLYDRDRYLGHIPKVELIRGDISETIPKFVEDNQHILVSLLFLDADLYEPTKVALTHILPRMPKGSIVAFDELDNPKWPGETAALLETLNIGSVKLRRWEWDPYISYFVVGE
jgi:Macrocin-O-methyltransferase (TylF)